jgi:uncharacterized membrane protein YdjX (TVP38/TMEM64 family)
VQRTSRGGGLTLAVSEQRRPYGWFKWLAAGLILIGLAVVLLIWGGPLYDLMANQERIRKWVESLGAWGPLAVVALEMAQVLLAPIPGQAIDATSGYLFGVWLGTIYAAIGIVGGSLLNFVLARHFGRPLVARLAGPDRPARLDNLAERGGALFFFLIWLFPFVPDDLACLAAGLTPMPVRQFLILMFLGRVPGIFVATWFGAKASSISPTWWAVLLGALTLAALALWRWGEQLQSFLLRFIDQLSNRPRR